MSEQFSQAPHALPAPVDEPQGPLQRKTRPLKLDAHVWGPRELMHRLGISRPHFHRLQKRGVFRHLQVKQPVGMMRYSRTLCEQFFAGQSTVRFGRGSRGHA